MPITTPTATAVGARSSGPPPGRAEVPPGFSAALTDAAQTWTALAEGQTQTPQEDPAASIPAEVQDASTQPALADAAPSAQPAATDAPATEPAIDALLSELAAVLASAAPAPQTATPPAGAVLGAAAAEEGLAAVTVALPTADEHSAAHAGETKTPAVAAAAATAVVPAQVVTAQAATAQAATAQAATAQSATAQGVAGATASPDAELTAQALPGVAAPALADGKPAAATVPAAAPPAAPAAAAAAASQGFTGQQAGGEPSPSAQPQPEPIVTAAPVASANAAAPAPSLSTAAAPVLTMPTVQTPTPGAQSAAIEALVQLAKQRGHSGARIALAPEELGGIRITLQLGTEGLTARLIADRPEAAAALQRAGSDLRASLEAQGIDLASLETSFAGDTGERRDPRADERLREGFGRSAGEPAGDGTILHLTLEERPSAQPLAVGRTIDLHA